MRECGFPWTFRSLHYGASVSEDTHSPYSLLKTFSSHFGIAGGVRKENTKFTRSGKFILLNGHPARKPLSNSKTHVFHIIQ